MALAQQKNKIRLMGKTILAYCLCAFALVMLAAGCGGRCRTSLLVADSLSDVDGQQAMAVLDSLRPHMDDASRRERMLYELARLKAQNMMYQLPASDSVVRPLLDYYESSGDDGHKADVYYIMGKVYRKMNDYPRAMDYFFRIIDTTPQEYVVIRGKAYNQLGYMFSDQNLMTDGIDMFIHALQCYKDAKDTVSMVYATRDIGSRYADMGRMDKARHYCEQALQLAMSIKSDKMIVTTNAQLARIFCKTHNYDLALKYIQRALDYNEDFDKVAVLAIASTTYDGLGRRDSALAGFLELLEIGPVDAKVDACKYLFGYYKGKDVQKELYYTQLYGAYVDSMNKSIATEAVKQKYNFYNYSVRERENFQLQAENYRDKIVIILLVSAVAVLSLVVLAAGIYIKKKREVQAQKLEKYEQMQVSASLEPDRKEEQQQQVEASLIYQRLKRRLNMPSQEKNLSDGEWKELAAMVNNIYAGFDEKLSDLCKMNVVDYRICLLLKVNVIPKDIATLVNRSKNSISSARSRLYERAFGEKKEPRAWDELIRTL